MKIFDSFEKLRDEKMKNVNKFFLNALQLILTFNEIFFFHHHKEAKLI